MIDIRQTQRPSVLMYVGKLDDCFYKWLENTEGKVISLFVNQL